MAWTYEARMNRAIAKLIDTGRIEFVETYKRARFFDTYAFRVGIAVSMTQWVNFDEVLQGYHKVFDPLDAHIVAVKNTFDIYVYGNDPAVLTWLVKHPSVSINTLVQTDPSFWHKKLPNSAKNTGKFFGEYRYRIRMRDSIWGLNPSNVAQLNELEMNHRMVLRKFHHAASMLKANPGMKIGGNGVRDTFIYLNKVNEVLVLKLMFGDQVSEVTERG